MRTQILGYVLMMGLVIGGMLPRSVIAQGSGRGCCGHGTGGGGMRGDASHRTDMRTFHFLFAHRQQIQRMVTPLPNGVETVTESDDPEVTRTLQQHVQAMRRRLQEHRPIHRRDPFFAELFAHGDQIEMQITNTDRGVRVKETSTDPYVVQLIQAHAEVVNQFLANGMAEMHRNHPLPARP